MLANPSNGPAHFDEAGACATSSGSQGAALFCNLDILAFEGAQASAHHHIRSKTNHSTNALNWRGLISRGMAS